MHASWDRAARARPAGASGIVTAVARAARDRLAAERDRWALWMPAFFGAGIALYFSLGAEPPWWMGIAALAGAVAGGVVLRRHAGPVLLLIAVATAGAGFARAQLQTWWVAAPVLQKRLGPVTVGGRVLRVSPHKDGWRLLIDTVSIRGLSAARTPVRVRVRTAVADGLQPGDSVTIRAVLVPPPRPSAPGAFDFARRAYFQRLGAVGFALGAPRLAARGDPGGFAVPLARLRGRITGRVLSAMPPQAGSVSAALMTGKRSESENYPLFNPLASGFPLP